MSTVSGNFTLFGSVANLIVAEKSKLKAEEPRPVARNFNCMVLLYKIVDRFNKILDFLTNLWFFKQNSGPFDKFVAYLK